MGNNCSRHPIFIVGVGRSGTTALFNGLIRHPHVLGARVELPFVSYLGPILRDYEDHRDREWLMNSMSVSKEYLHDQFRRLAFEVAVGRCNGLVSRLKNLARGDFHILSKRFWCAKTYFDFDGYQGLKHLYPDIKLIYMIRNGCGVVQSRTKFESFKEREFAEHCQEWTDGVAKYRFVSHVESSVQVRHEDLVDAPEEVYKAIFECAGLTHHEAPAKFVRKTLVHPLDEPTKGDVDVRATLSNRPPAHADWTPAQREIFKEICGDAMLEVGYEMPF